MIPRLRDDPAWVRYEWELRHQAIVEFQRAMTEMNIAIGEAFRPIADSMLAAIEKWNALAEAIRRSERRSFANRLLRRYSGATSTKEIIDGEGENLWDEVP